MYAALDKKGTLTYAQDAVKKENYFCSHCSQPVKLIVNETSCFFRHISREHNTVNERLIHQQGKVLIATVLEKYLSAKIEVEYFLPQIQQRPDIFINRHLAIEYQCAKIDVKTLSDRVAGYWQERIKNVWILGGNYLDIKVRREHLKFISYSQELGYYLLMLDSQQRRFIIYYQIKLVGPFSKIISQRQVFNYHELGKIFTFQPQINPVKSVMMNNFLIQKIRRQNDSKSQQVKMDFYSQHQMTVEQYLAERIFKPQPPIYQHPLWQIACGQTRTLLKQPLLNQRPLKKPPQK